MPFDEDASLVGAVGAAGAAELDAAAGAGLDASPSSIVAAATAASD